MQSLALDHQANNDWYRQIAAGWARRMIMGDLPGAWAQHTETEVQFAMKQLHLQPGDAVLDLGCGWGRHSLELAAYGLRVTGLDLSSELLQLARYNARRHNLNIEWVEADVAQLPLRGTFDAIAQFCGNLMTWFSTPEKTLNVLWDVTNLLKPGGRFVFGDPDWTPELPLRKQHWDEWQGGAAIYRHTYDAQRRMSHTQAVIFGPDHARQEYRRQTWWPNRDDMEMLFAQAGLTVCACYNGCVDKPYDPNRSGLVYVLARE
ncbi:MAG: class I SAM-dependent methyltransferase [Anaerolineae bacterium]|nr:class I SAM-dependent methyltransferase [Anaerolineae bacterium]